MLESSVAMKTPVATQANEGHGEEGGEEFRWSSFIPASYPKGLLLSELSTHKDLGDHVVYFSCSPQPNILLTEVLPIP